MDPTRIKQSQDIPSDMPSRPPPRPPASLRLAADALHSSNDSSNPASPPSTSAQDPVKSLRNNVDSLSLSNSSGVKKGSSRNLSSTADSSDRGSESSDNTYSVSMVPVAHESSFLVGMKFETVGDKIVVAYFTQHPVTKADLPAEASGQIRLNDELIAINDIDISEGAFPDRFKVLEDRVKGAGANTRLKFTFRSVQLNTASARLTAKRPAAPTSAKNSPRIEKPVSARMNPVNGSGAMTIKNQLFVRCSGVNPKKFKVVLVPDIVQGKPKMGVLFQIVGDKVVVVDFPKNPVTNEPLPAQRAGRINYSDQLVAIDGEELPTDPNELKVVWSILEAAFKSPNALTNGVKLTFLSSRDKVAWFPCPGDDCDHTMVINDDQRTDLLRATFNKNANVKLTCKKCGTESISLDGIPKLI